MIDQEFLELCLSQTQEESDIEDLINKAVNEFINALSKIDSKYDTVEFSNRLDNLLARTI